MIKIAVLGYGTIGSGVVEVLETNREHITQTAGQEIEVKYVLDLRDFPGDPIQEKIVHDYEIIKNHCRGNGWRRAGIYFCKRRITRRQTCGNIQ